MMMINRRLGQGIVINESIHITVLKIEHCRIELGITVPAGLSLRRLEELSPTFESPEALKASMIMIDRRLDEGIGISGNIRIIVLKIGQRRVRLGLTAPASVSIRRLEELPIEGSKAVEAPRESTAELLLFTSSLRKPPRTKIAARKRFVGHRRVRTNLSTRNA